ncbi:MAG: BTAD domain-containing putative transcriptional regulator [Micromonosporaceae bacterium]
MEAVQVRLLGPVELSIDGQLVDAGSPKQRCVLAVLGLAAGSAVRPETLIDRVWGEAPPRSARDTLYTHIARLRALLPAGVLDRGSAGYTLTAEVDALRFRELVDQSRRASDQDKPRLLREAIGLWRGVPLTGISGEWAETVRDSLDRLRLDALVDRIDLDLRAVRVAPELIGELTDLVAAYPLKERFAGRLMKALYRGDRAEEALSVYERTRRHLAEELGNDPGPELRRLHQQILRQDPALGGLAAAIQAPVPRQLPIAPAVFVGRAPEIAAATEALTADGRYAPPVVAINGPGGVGKSALALRVAHAVAERYPDGQLYLDLQGSSPGLAPLPPLEALGRLLRGLGVPGSATPADLSEAAARYRSLLADRRVLVLLDNAADASQVRALLPGHAGCGVLITSRTVLAGLDDARHLALDVLDPAESADLLSLLDPAGRPALDPQRAEMLADLCGHLPLALRIAAARITSRPDWSLATFVDRLADEQHRLDQLGHADRSVRACFQTSYQALERGDAGDQAAAAAFRLLGLPDGPDISLPIAARLLDVPPASAELTLDRLIDAQLLASPEPARYRMHDLLRLYARELAGAEADGYAALERTWRCYVATAAHAAQLLRPGRRKDLVVYDEADALPLTDHRDGLMWLSTEAPNLLAAAHEAATAPGDLPNVTVRLAHALFGYMHTNVHWRPLHELDMTALDIARARRDRPAEAQLLSDLGVMVWRTGDGDRAVTLFAKSVDLRREIGDALGEAFSLFNLGSAYNERGDLDKARPCIEAVLDISRATGYESGEALSLNTLGDLHRKLGHLESCTAHLRASLAIYRRLGDTLGEAFALRSLGDAHIAQNQISDAIACFEEALAIHRARSSAVEAAWNLVRLAEAYRLAHDLGRALEAGREALSVGRLVGTLMEQALALRQLGYIRLDLGDSAAAQSHWRDALPIFERLGAEETADVRRLLLLTESGDPDPGGGDQPTANLLA